MSANRALREQQLELYRFQAEEIDTAALDPGEYEELEARASVLQNLEKLKKEAGGVHGALYEADGSVLERLKTLSGVLEELADLDANLKPVSNALKDAAIQVEEVSFDLSRYLDKLDLDPGELAEANERLNAIHRILNKYGGPTPRPNGRFQRRRQGRRARRDDPFRAARPFRHRDGLRLPPGDRREDRGAGTGHRRPGRASKVRSSPFWRN